MHRCTEARFLSDVKEHSITVIRDDGVNRHLRFRKGTSSIYGFDLITWPGFLCITGDCGTYVFSRLDDMFKFFRYEKGEESSIRINAQYWGEKLQSIGVNSGYREFCEDAFKERVRSYFDDYWEDGDNKEKEACWLKIKSDVLSDYQSGEQRSYEAVRNFEYERFIFQHFFDGGGTEQYTSHYIWCLYAIVWGISKYDDRASDRLRNGQS